MRRWMTALALCALIGGSAAAGAAESAPPTVLSLQPDQWTITNVGPTKLQVSVKDDGLVLHWPGGAGKAVVQSKQTVPLESHLHDGLVRFTAQVNILNNRYGGAFDVMLQPVKADGKQTVPYLMRRPSYGGTTGLADDSGLYAPPGSWAMVDFNYRVPKTVAGAKARFELQGNPITVTIGQVSIRDGLTWKRGRPSVPPEPRNFDEQHVKEILAARRRIMPKLVRKDGRVALTLDGWDVFPACYTRGPFYPQYTRYGAFTRAGFDIFRIYASFGPLSRTHKVGIGNMWRGKGKFDFSELDRELKVIANINPNAKVIVTATISPYHGWAAEHPDSIVTNAQGQPMIAYGGEKLQYGGKPDYNNIRETHYAPSFYGGAFPADAADAVKHLAEFLQTSEAGKIVFEVDFGGGTDGQLYPWDRDVRRGQDNSPVAVEAWRNFLRKRYRNDAQALRTAWKDPHITFDAAPVPDTRQRGYSTNTIQRRGIDYNDFISDAMADFLLGLGKGLKTGSNGRLLAGCYYSDNGREGIISHTAMNRVMTSPYMDAIRSVAYPLMSGSWWRYDKLIWLELDMRPPMPNPMQYYTQGLNYPSSYFRTLLWRNASMALTDLRGGYYHYDMAESWYTDPKLVQEMGKVRAGLEASLNDSVNVPISIGIFTDERVAYRLPDHGDYRLMRTSAYGMYQACARSGVPYARYLLNDALDPSFKLPKICILRVPMAMTPQEADLLRNKARESDSILIWGYGVAGATLVDTNAKAVSGFDAAPSDAVRGKRIVVEEMGSLTAGLAGRFMGPPPMLISHHSRWQGQPYVIKTEPEDIVLGRYAGTDQAGVVLRKRNGLTQIIFGRPGAISPQFLRNLAKTVGITPFSTANDEIRFGSGILAIYADQGGQRNITLPAGMTAAASPTGHSFTPTKDGFTFQIGYADTAVFKITENHHP